MPLFKNVHSWFYGLLSAIIGGASAAVSSGFASMLLDPKDFNFGDGLSKTLKLMGITALLGAVSHTVAYLMKSPLPPRGDDTDFITKP
jgi:hypothetical protein